MLLPPPSPPLFPYTTLFRSTMVARLADDHASARALAEGLRGIDPSLVDLSRVDTNIVQIDTRASSRSAADLVAALDRKSTRLNSSHTVISYAVFCLKKKKKP